MTAVTGPHPRIPEGLWLRPGSHRRSVPELGGTSARPTAQCASNCPMRRAQAPFCAASRRTRSTPHVARPRTPRSPPRFGDELIEHQQRSTAAPCALACALRSATASKPRCLLAPADTGRTPTWQRPQPRPSRRAPGSRCRPDPIDSTPARAQPTHLRRPYDFRRHGRRGWARRSARSVFCPGLPAGAMAVEEHERDHRTRGGPDRLFEARRVVDRHSGDGRR